MRGGCWLTRRRVVVYAGILLGFELVTFLFLVAGTHGWVVPLDRPNTTDFASFYAAGELADLGSADDAYVQPEHYAAEQRATEPGIHYVYFYYPPIFLLLCAIFARLPYLAAFAAFEGATLIPCLAVARRILGEIRWRTMIPLLAYPAVFINIGVGQNAFITAALFGYGTLLVDRRPILAGLLFGAICYKPHFGLLIPVALIAGGRWRAFAAAAVSASTLAVMSLILFGWETWRNFISAITASHATYESGVIDYAAFTSIFGALRLMDAGPGAAYAIQAAVSAAMAALVAMVWRRNLSLPVRAATLTAATLAAVPLSLFYDLMLAGVSILWLVRKGRDNGFLDWEKSLLLLVFMLPLLSRGVGIAGHLPLAAAGVLVLVGLCFAHARAEILYRSHNAITLN